MPDKDQFGIYSKDDLSLIKNTFAGNDTLLYAIRKVFLQFPLTEPEKGLIRLSVTPEVYRVLKMRMLPDLEPCYPLGQLPSILSTLTQDLKTKDADAMKPQFEAKQIEVAYLAQQFAVLQDLDAPQPIKLAELADISSERAYVNMTAYLFLLGYIDPSLNMIKVIAGETKESPEDQIKRLKRDSNQ